MVAAALGRVVLTGVAYWGGSCSRIERGVQTEKAEREEVVGPSLSAAVFVARSTQGRITYASALGVSPRAVLAFVQTPAALERLPASAATG